jgi:hypothetical protein
MRSRTRGWYGDHLMWGGRRPADGRQAGGLQLCFLLASSQQARRKAKYSQDDFIINEKPHRERGALRPCSAWPYSCTAVLVRARTRAASLSLALSLRLRILALHRARHGCLDLECHLQQPLTGASSRFWQSRQITGQPKIRCNSSFRE